MPLIVTDLNGSSEMLTDYKELTRKRRVNGERSLSFLLLKTKRNQHAFDLVKEESKIELNGEKYRIKNMEERLIGTTPVKQIQADDVLFDIIDIFQYTTLADGDTTIAVALTFALNNTGYTFSVIDSFGTVKFENFGNDNALSLFKTILEKFQAEYTVVGNDIRIYNQIGANSDFQFRYKHNIKTLAKTIKTDNLSTYIKGYGKQNDDGTYVVTAEYTSPNSATYGIRHAKPVVDGRFTDQTALQNYLQEVIQDTPEISIKIDFADLSKAGYPFGSPGLGDTVYLIYEPLNNINITARILEIVDYPESPKSPEVTLSNFKENIIDVVFRNTKQQLEKIYDSNTNKVRFNVLDEAVKIATEAINNSRTELQYPEGGGIRAVDPNNVNRFVAFTSAGIGVTTDGGLTYPQAITADGINTALLIAGQIKTNNISLFSDLTGDAQILIDGNGLVATDGTKTTFEITPDGNAVFAGDVVGGRIISNSDIDITTDLKVGKNVFIGTENDTDAAKKIYFYFNSKTSPTTVPASISSYLVEGDGKGIRIDASEELHFTCGSSDIKQFLDSLNSQAVIEYQSTSPSTFPLLMKVNGKLQVTDALDLTTATITGLDVTSAGDHNHGGSTGSAGSHNHGIPDGTQLALNGGGYVTWVSAGSHSHSISASGNHTHTIS